MADSMENDPKQAKDSPLSKPIGWLIGGLVLLSAIAGGIWWWHELRVSISTDNAQVTGDITYISSKISGCLKRLYVSEGDAVVAGQKLAELDHGALALAMKQAAAALELAKANYAKLPYDVRSAQLAVDTAYQQLQASQAQQKKVRTAFDDAQRDLDQMNLLYQSGLVSHNDLAKARSAFNQAGATLDAAATDVQAARAALANAQTQLKAVNHTGADAYLAQLRQAQATYDSARLNYADSFIDAPMDGTVIQVPAVAGENLSINQEILAIADLRATWVVANIKENKFGRIRIGQRADVRVDAYPGAVFRGKVAALGKATQSTFALIPTQNDTGNYTKVTQLLPVKIEVDRSPAGAKGHPLMPGMSVEVKIHTAAE